MKINFFTLLSPVLLGTSEYSQTSGGAGAAATTGDGVNGQGATSTVGGRNGASAGVSSSTSSTSGGTSSSTSGGTSSSTSGGTSSSTSGGAGFATRPGLP